MSSDSDSPVSPENRQDVGASAPSSRLTAGTVLSLQAQAPHFPASGCGEGLMQRHPKGRRSWRHSYPPPLPLLKMSACHQESTNPGTFVSHCLRLEMVAESLKKPSPAEQ